MKHRMIRILHRSLRLALFFICAALLPIPLLAAAPSGTYSFVVEKSGTRAGDQAVITLQFDNTGTVTLKAVMPGEELEETGRFTVTGDKITVVFDNLDIGCATARAFLLTDTHLTLPFQVFSADTGKSMWRKAVPTTIAQVLVDVKVQVELRSNASQRQEIDTIATNAATWMNRGLADSYYRQGVFLQLSDHLHEAIYAFYKAGELAPFNGIYQNNLAVALSELGETAIATVLLQKLAAKYPNLDEIHGNLGIVYQRQGKCAKAVTSLKKALTLKPQTGSWEYGLGKSYQCLKNNAESEKYFALAFSHGVAGAGREGDPARPGGSAAAAQGTPPASPDAHAAAVDAAAAAAAAASSKPTRAPTPLKPGETIPKEWVGHYEARYARAETDDKKLEGAGPAATLIQLRTLSCAKKFSMDIYADGTVVGSGRVLYAWLGNAVNMVSAFAGPLDMFFSTIKDGAQVRDWNFKGRIDKAGNIRIEGRPTESLDLLNVGEWQKITPWAVLPPTGTMAGPADMKLATEVDGPPSIQVLNRVFDLNDRIIKKVRFSAYIFKSDADVVPECKKLEPIKATCEQPSEYLKTSVSVGPEGKAEFKASRQFDSAHPGGDLSTEAGLGSGPVSMSSSGEMSLSSSSGGVPVGATCSVKVNPSSGTTEVAIGIGIDSSSVAPGPFKVTEKVELIYDSACGFGIRATAGVSAGVASAGVEGAVFFRARPKK